MVALITTGNRKNKERNKSTHLTLSLLFCSIPVWLGNDGGNFCKITKVWRRRFYYMDQFVPKWLRYVVPFVKNEEWQKEENEFKRFKKYSESAFGKHFRFPSKVFNDYKSEETKESVEEVISSSSE